MVFYDLYYTVSNLVFIYIVIYYNDTVLDYKYDNSHYTHEYCPFYCANCGIVFGWFRNCRQDSTTETLCDNCFETLPEPVNKSNS